MGKTLRRPIQRNLAGKRATQPQQAQPTSPAAAAPQDRLRLFAKEDEPELRRVLLGSYDIPGLHFATPPTILDIGAHAGAATTFFLRRWPGCSIHAYEPHPEAVRWFQENTRDSGWSVSLHTRAVVGAEWPDSRALLLDGLRGPWHRSLYQLGAQLTTGVQVDVVRAAALPEAQVLKVSTNGCELAILDSYPFVMRLRAVLARCARKADHAAIVERLRPSGLSLARDDSRQGEMPGEMVFVRS